MRTRAELEGVLAGKIARAALDRPGDAVDVGVALAGRLDARNSASARVLERLGMRREALFRENELVKGEWTDELVYALLEDEWLTRAAGA